jgi:hypothetical protein
MLIRVRREPGRQHGLSDGKFRLPHGLVYAAVLTAPAWLVGLASIFVRAQWLGFCMVLAVVCSFVVAAQLFPDTSGVPAVVCAVLGGLAAIVMFIWVPLAVLDFRGDEVTAVVTVEHVVWGKHSRYDYQLSGSDGRPIAGVLTQYYRAFKPGDHVDVLVDRYGQLDPVTASETEDERKLGIAAGSLLAATAALSIGIGSFSPMVHLRRPTLYRPRH